VPNFAGAGVKNQFQHPAMKSAAAACLVAAACCTWSFAAEPGGLAIDYTPFLTPAHYQESTSEPLIPPAPSTAPSANEPYSTSPVPLLDESAPRDEYAVPPVASDLSPMRRGVKPYGGGHGGDWPWGCGGSPFRTGPGACDTWEVGCRWDVAVDGMVMLREDTDLLALEAIMRQNSAAGTVGLTPAYEQFDYTAGGRVWMTSKVPNCLWQMHAGYEGFEEWNSSVVFPKLELDIPPFAFPTEPAPLPPDPFPEGTEQRSLHYRSSLHSGELNIVRNCHPAWRPYCGVRYMKFDDEINDFLDQEAQPPIAGPRTTDDNGIGPVSVTDRLNLFDIENNLIGFQVGVRHDLWRPNHRFAIEGFANSGVYYNHIKYTNFMGIFTTQEYADNTATLDDDESRIDFSDTANNDVREYDEIAYIAEASISGVCRLNKCWAARAGYQALWISNVHLAEDAFLGSDLEGRSLFFHGWHAGIEHRR
jgi:hypothetical protein